MNGLQKTNNSPAVAGFGNNSLVQVDMRELSEIAEAAIASGMFTDLKNAGQAKMKILAGREVGLEPIAALMSIHFFNNRVVYGASVYSGLIKSSAKYDYQIIRHDNNGCEIAFYERRDGELVQCGPPVSYTRDDARLANLADKEVYKKFGDDMFFAGAIRKGFRRYCSELLRGKPVPADAVTDSAYFDITASAATPTPVSSFAEPKSNVEPIIDVEPIEEPATTAPAVETGSIPESEAVSSTPTDREIRLGKITTLCSELNKAGDSIIWGNAVLREWVAERYGVQNGLEALLDGDLDDIAAEFGERLSMLLPEPALEAAA